MWQIIINPSAGSGKAGKSWAFIAEELKKAGILYAVTFSERALHCTEIAESVIAAGARKILAIGGDGTNHEVVNGIMRQQIVPSTAITYGFIPVGRGNDWVKTHKIPTDIVQNIAMLKAEKTGFQDIGLAKYEADGQREQRYFVNVAGMAYDAYVSRISNEKRHKIHNSFHYYLLIFKCLFEYKNKKAQIFLDGKLVAQERFYTINIGLCKYSGGGMQFVPHAIPDDGLFALSYIRAISKLRVILSTHYLYGGKIAKFQFASLHKGKKIRVESLDDTPTLLELDGEFVGETPVEFELLPKALKMVF